MSSFALDFEIEMPYSLAPPQGWDVHFGSLKKKQMAKKALGLWLLALGKNTNPKC
jgi:hypothetical protein